MTTITDEIATIEKELHGCFETDSPIDPKKIKRLHELKFERLKELVQTHEQRLTVMQGHTRTLTKHLTGLESQGRPDVIEQIHCEMDKYDVAAVHWVNAESFLWEESQAFSIAAGILILSNEIH